MKRLYLGLGAFLVALVGLPLGASAQSGAEVVFVSGSTPGGEYRVTLPAADNMRIQAAPGCSPCSVSVYVNDTLVASGYGVDYRYSATRNASQYVRIVSPDLRGLTYTVGGYIVPTYGASCTSHWACRVDIIPANWTFAAIWAGLHALMFEGLIGTWLTLLIGAWMAFAFVGMIVRMVQDVHDDPVSVSGTPKEAGTPAPGIAPNYMEVGRGGRKGRGGDGYGS